MKTADGPSPSQEAVRGSGNLFSRIQVRLIKGAMMNQENPMSEPSFKICDLFSIEGNCPLGRIGTPADMAGIAIYLASPAACYIM